MNKILTHLAQICYWYGFVHNHIQSFSISSYLTKLADVTQKNPNLNPKKNKNNFISE